MKMRKIYSMLGIVLSILLIASFAMAKTPSTLTRNDWMALQRFHHGLSVEGGELKINGRVVPLGEFSNVYYVGPTNAADTLGNDQGKSWDKPWATLDYAIGQCTENNGDVIFVLPNYAQTMSGADAVDADIAGVYIIGLGNGDDMPTFTYSAAAGEFVLGDDNVYVSGLRFVSGASPSVTMGISVEAGADDCTVDNCLWAESGNSDYAFIDVIDLASGATNFTIQNSTYRDSGTAGGTYHFIEAGAGVNSGLRVINNYISGYFAVSAIWSDAIDLDCLIKDNVIVNLTSGQHAIEFTTTATGVIVGNRIFTDAEATSIDPGSMYCLDNLVTTAIDASGVIWPKPDDTATNFIGADNTDNVASTSSVTSNRDGSILERLEDVVNQAERCVEKTTANVASANLFKVDNGPIQIIELIGVVTTNIQDQACTMKLMIDPTTPATDTDLSGTTNVQAVAAGTIFGITGTFGDELRVAVTGVTTFEKAQSTIICPEGMIEVVCSATNTGAVTWKMRYKPLDPHAVVTAQ